MSMRTAPERLLVRLEWLVVRRLDGRMAGGYRTAHRGTGTDLVGLREYTEGDDARHIDWNVTARLNEPQLRVFTEDRELTVWLVLDRSASMTVGGPERGKHDVLSELALVLARLFGRSGNRVGALLYDTGVVRIVPAGTGRRHALRIGAELARPAGGGPGVGQYSVGQYRGTTDLAAMLDAAAKLARRRALIVVISDFIGDGDWGRSLLRLTPRHEVVALRVTEDAETGEQLVIDSGDPLLRARLRAGVEERDARLAAGMRRAGVPIHRIGTDADLATALIEVIASTQRRRA
jgi:uncharacterized protein (DUF58 family)